VTPEQIIEEFKEALRRAELTPRDISPLIGLAHTSIYRAIAGREAVSKHMLCSFRFSIKFLRWYVERKEQIALSNPNVIMNLDSCFYNWLQE